MWLLFDIGNTRLKWRWANAGGFLDGESEQLPVPGDEAQFLARCVTGGYVPEKIVISNVAGVRFDHALRDCSQAKWGISPHFVRPSNDEYGIINGYDDPASLGVDRWCALIGARVRMPGKLCIVDCGTAVTLDVLSPSGQHMGGLVLPGIRAMIRALTSSANGLRLDIDAPEGRFSLGHNTEDCVTAGIIAAISGSIEFALNRLGSEERPTVVLTGGNAAIIAAALACPSRVEQDLVFYGLAEVARAL